MEKIIAMMILAALIQTIRCIAQSKFRKKPDRLLKISSKSQVDDIDNPYMPYNKLRRPSAPKSRESSMSKSSVNTK